MEAKLPAVMWFLERMASQKLILYLVTETPPSTSGLYRSRDQPSDLWLVDCELMSSRI